MYFFLLVMNEYESWAHKNKGEKAVICRRNGNHVKCIQSSVKLHKVQMLLNDFRIWVANNALHISLSLKMYKVNNFSYGWFLELKCMLLLTTGASYEMCKKYTTTELFLLCHSNCTFYSYCYLLRSRGGTAQLKVNLFYSKLCLKKLIPISVH